MSVVRAPPASRSLHGYPDAARNDRVMRATQVCFQERTESSDFGAAPWPLVPMPAEVLRCEHAAPQRRRPYALRKPLRRLATPPAPQPRLPQPLYTSPGGQGRLWLCRTQIDTRDSEGRPRVGCRLGKCICIQHRPAHDRQQLIQPNLQQLVSSWPAHD